MRFNVEKVRSEVAVEAGNGASTLIKINIWKKFRITII
jgi:hypothetical protein